MIKLRKMTSKVVLAALATVALSGSTVLGAVYTFGTGTASNTTTGYPTPLGNYFWGNRTQYLYEAAELTTEGMTAGETISEVGFYIENLNAMPDLENFTISLKNTSATDMSVWDSGTSVVYGPITLPVASLTSGGWNMITLDSQFIWNGTSNLTVEVCSNNSAWISNGNASVRYTITTLNPSARYYRADATGVCSNTLQTGVNANRANLRLVANPPTAEDIFLTGITPPTLSFVGQTQDFGITISNVGTSGITADGNIDLDIDGDGIFDVTDTFTGLPGSTALTYIVSATMPGTLGTYNVTAAITLTSGVDGNSSNDTSSTSYTVLPTDDVEVTSVSSAGAAAGSPLTINVDVTNNGLSAADGDVNVDIDNDGVDDATGNFTGLASGATVTVAVISTAPGTAGNYTANATVILTSAVDADPSNDTGSTTYTVTPTCTIAFPAVENFDSFATGIGAFDPATGWEQDTSDGGNWTVFGGSTSSFSTGPTQDFTSEQGLGSGLYLYTESSGTAIGTVFNVISPCYDLSFLTAPQVQFYVHMMHNNQTAGEFHLDVLNLTTGLTDLSVWSHIGQLQSAEADPWEKVSASLAAHAGDQVRLRWRSIIGGPTNFYNDTGLDQVRVGDAPTDDVGINSVTAVSPVFTNSIFNVDVEVENFAQNAADGDVNVDIDGDGIADGTNSFAGLAFGGTTTVSVTVTAAGIAGAYTADATVVLTSGLDSDPLNDTGSAGFTVLPTADVAVVSVTAPAGLLNPGDAVQVDVVVSNNSQAAADLDVSIDYENDGVDDDVQTITGLASSASQTVTFNTTAPSQGGIITVLGTVLLTSDVDQDPSNDSGTDTYNVLPSNVTSYPYTETFDTWATGNGPFDITTGWIQNTNDQQNWTVFGGSTSSSNTGPTQDYTSEQGGGAGLYLYTETSGPAIGNVFAITSIGFDLSSLTAPKLSFFYHAYHFNQTAGEFHVDIENMTTGTTDLNVWSLIGQWQTAEADPWANKTISLIPYVGNTIRVIFRSVVGGPTNFYNDTGLDQVSIFDSADDISITAFAINGAAPTGNPVIFDVTILNAGSNTADGTVEVDFDSDGIADGSDTFSGLASGASTTLSISGTAPATIGNYTATANATLTSGTDGNSLDNTATTNYTVTPVEDVAVVSVTATPNPVASGSSMDFDVNVQNLGASPADVLVEIDYENDGIVDASSNISGLASGANQVETFTVSAPATTGNLTASVNITLQSGIDGDPSNDTGSVAYSVIPANAFAFGTGTATNTNTGYPTPLGNWFWGNRTQYLYEASELISSGMSTGEMISEVGFYIENLNALPDLENFTISLKNTSATDMSVWDTGTTVVYGPITLPVASLSSGSWNLITLDTQYTWDGTSNLTVEVCSNNSAWISNGNASVRYTTTTLNPSARYYRADATGVCSNTSQTGVSPNRANLMLVANPPSAEDIFLANITPPSIAFAGQTQDFGVTVSNIGTAGLSADGNIDLDVDGDGIADVTDTFTGLAGGATMTYNVSATMPGTLGTYNVVGTVSLTSGVDGNNSNDSHSTSYTVFPTSNMAINSINLPGTVGANSTFAVDVIVENLSLAPADADVSIDYENDGIDDDFQTITSLASGATTTVTFNLTASASGNQTVSATVTQTNDIDQDPSDDTGIATYFVVPASGGPDTFGNTWISSLDGAFAYNFVDISGNPGAVNQNLTDDSFSTVTLGAAFNFYGTVETSLNICSNGWANFGAGSTSLGGPAGVAFPNAQIPNGVLAIFWDDLNPSSQGDVYFLDNTAVDNKSYIQWNGVVAFAGAVPMTFQIVLDHSNNYIEYHYMNIDENDAVFSSIGIENQGGSDGLQISNDAPFVSDGLGVQIKAPLTQPDPPVVIIDGASLSWTAVTGASNYWVYTSATPNGPWSAAIPAGNVLTWTDPAGTATTEPNYYVTADTAPPVVAPSKSQNQVTSVVVNYNNTNPYGLPAVVTPEVIAKYSKLKADGVLSQTELNWLQNAMTSKRNATRSSVNK